MLLAVFGLRADAATISVSGPSVGSLIDVTVQATNLFAGRDPLTDGIIAYGFNISISDPTKLQYLGATSGPLFDAATTQPGTDVFGAASGFGIFDPVVEPLLLVTLHFGAVGVGPTDITLSSNLANAFQGLQYFNRPFQEDISGKLSVTAVPEPSTFGFIGIVLLLLAVGREISLRAKPRKDEHEQPAASVWHLR